MLQKVVIEHFRSCENVTIDNIGPSLVLVGPNGSGKTNILRAILWAAEAALSREALDIWDNQLRSIVLDFEIDDHPFRYAIRVPPGRRDPDTEYPFSSILLEESISVLGPEGTWETLVDRDGTALRFRDGRKFSVPPSTPLLPLVFAYLPQYDPLHEKLSPVKDLLAHPLLPAGRAKRVPGTA